MLGAFHKLYPDMIFHIEQKDTADIVKGIAAYQGEIGFVGAKIENPKCVYTRFMSERLILIAPHEARFECLEIDDVAKLLHSEYFVMRETGSGTRLEYEQYLKALGVKTGKLKVSAYFGNTQSIIHAVASGMGLSIVSEIAAKPYIQHKRVLPIYVDSLPQRHFYMVQKKNGVLSQSVENVVRFVLDYQRESLKQ